MNHQSALARFEAYTTLTPADRDNLLPLIEQPQTIQKGDHLFFENDPAATMALLLEGWTASTMHLPGGSRQMLKVHLPGDMVGLPGLPFDAMPDSIVALTDATYATVTPEALGHLFEVSPRIAALLFLISQEERCMLMDRLTTVGRVDALGRLAGFLLQLLSRLERHAPFTGRTIRSPLSQRDFADLIGTSEPHCNRVIQELRRRKLIDWQRGEITLLDRAALRKLSMLPERRIERDQSWVPAGR